MHINQYWMDIKEIMKSPKRVFEEQRQAYPSTATRHRFFGISLRNEALSPIDSDLALNCKIAYLHKKNQSLTINNLLIKN